MRRGEKRRGEENKSSLATSSPPAAWHWVCCPEKGHCPLTSPRCNSIGLNPSAEPHGGSSRYKLQIVPLSLSISPTFWCSLRQLQSPGCWDMQLPASESNSTLRSILLLVFCQLSREAAQKPAVMAAQRAAGLDLQCRKEMGSSWSCFCLCASRRCAGITMTYEQKKTVLSSTRQSILPTCELHPLHRRAITPTPGRDVVSWVFFY